mmetsp:Transcript_15176/g.38066  ORF Transcript_15176/g.38066 Transcript_15176/m.38066 type:complete len:258 (+) Transcript_15176:1745-2518(+)
MVALVVPWEGTLARLVTRLLAVEARPHDPSNQRFRPSGFGVRHLQHHLFRLVPCQPLKHVYKRLEASQRGAVALILAEEPVQPVLRPPMRRTVGSRPLNRLQHTDLHRPLIKLPQFPSDILVEGEKQVDIEKLDLHTVRRVLNLRLDSVHDQCLKPMLRRLLLRHEVLLYLLKQLLHLQVTYLAHACLLQPVHRHPHDGPVPIQRAESLEDVEHRCTILSVLGRSPRQLQHLFHYRRGVLCFARGPSRRLQHVGHML